MGIGAVTEGEGGGGIRDDDCSFFAMFLCSSVSGDFCKMLRDNEGRIANESRLLYAVTIL